jgi:hypothetical protein
LKQFSLLAAALCAALTATAADVPVIFDPLTVKPGEEMRITLFNPSSETILVRVFAFNSAENTYDEGEYIKLAPGKLRFFDLKAAKEFVGIGGIIETIPDPPKVEPQAAAAQTDASAQTPTESKIMLEDILVSSIKSRGSLQHRSVNGQSQTMGYSFGASQTTGRTTQTTQAAPPEVNLKAITSGAKRVSSSEWLASPEY